MAGFDNNVMYADNVDFTGSVDPAGKVTLDGQLLIGSTAAPHIRVATITQGQGVSVTNANGSITLTNSSTITGNSGAPLPLSGGNWDIVTANSTPVFARPGSTLVLDFTATSNLGLGSSYPSLAGGLSNVSVGKNALNAVTSGSANLCLSEDAGKAITTGSNNIALGYGAMAAVTTQSSSIAIGRQALELATVGSTVAIGTGCLAKLTTGVENVAIGTSCMASLIDGIRNTAVGASALGNPASVQDGVMIGWNAGINATGNGNCVVGSQAFIGSGAAANNCLTGFQAGTGMTSGSANAGYGYATLNASRAASNNSCIGYESLFQLVSGTNNTAIGNLAGYNYAGAESNNICIGNRGTLGESNVMRLGSAGSGTDQVNTCFIAGITGVLVTGAAVLVDANGQCGVAVSALRFKQDIVGIGTLSKSIYELRPVRFEYIQSPGATSYGLIAEEVNEVMPELVVRDKEGEILTVKYNEIIALLLNEVQDLNRRLLALGG